MTYLPVRLTRRWRWILALSGLAGLALLATAACLRPDPRGQRTHEQLGLPPCTFRTLFGIRCPACGMTTSWSHLMHGQPAQALRTHVVGTVSAVAVLLGSLAALGLATLGVAPCWRPTDRWIVAAILSMGLLWMVEWGLRLL